ncbi:MAG: undecaprenyl-diphosphate phosphatase [Parvibaculaceae bacterium]|nr:undecaprenyl-diphosphate phosphatase [Parvibaculaceae bacterium]
MIDTTLLQAAFLGVVEGVTEFLPVSSTGHLILAGELVGFDGPIATVFDVVIQLGAILAICVLYFQRLWGVLVRLPSDPDARRFVLLIVAAFLPAAVIGFLLHDFIKAVLFSPYVVCSSLIIGGIAILAIERIHPKQLFHSVERIPYGRAVAIGFIQCLAMIPGVSRSGASILGAYMLNVDRKTAAEFSFFLAIPTMLGATVLDLWKARHLLDPDYGLTIAVGFVLAFVSALIVVKWLIGFVSQHTFVVFGWYRIVLGLLLLGWFALYGVTGIQG